MKENDIIFPWKLFISLIFLNFIPNLYETVKIFFINSSATSLDVVSQIEWFDLINEVLITFLTVPLYALLNKEEISEKFKARVFQTFFLTCILYCLFSIIVYVNAHHMVTFMTGNNHAETIQYLRLETIAFVIGIIPSFFLIIFTIVRKEILINLILFVKMFAIIIGDFILIDKYGSFGIAYANMLINILLAIVCITIALHEQFIQLDFHFELSFLKSWFRVGSFCAGQIFLDNWIYAVLVCKMVNAVSEQGNYWIVNNFIWNWLLVPCIALGEIVKTDCKNGFKNLNMKQYCKLICMIVVVWICTMPSWSWIFKTLMHVNDVNAIMKIVFLLVPFYVAYMIASVLDNVFYGLGKTKYNFIISMVVNIVYYGIVYILFKIGIFTMNIHFIIYMFGFGMVVHAIFSIVLFRHLQKSKY